MTEKILTSKLKIEHLQLEFQNLKCEFQKSSYKILSSKFELRVMKQSNKRLISKLKIAH